MLPMDDVTLSPSEFVALLNQTLEFAYPSITVQGELSTFRVSKNRWVYFDLKDETASVKCFGTVYQLPGPLEDGMLVKVTAQPRLHPQFGFSLNVQSMLPAGEGSIKKAAHLLEAQLAKEGLFDAERKRPLPYPPEKIGLIASKESAAYSDFLKIMNARWGGVEVHVYDVQVQGEQAVHDVVEALHYFNTHAEDVDVLVLTRGGGSPDDLAAFSAEHVTRAVAGSRIPTLVAIGHERDVSLAELAADQRASTPSNAAELLFPHKNEALAWLQGAQETLQEKLSGLFTKERETLSRFRDDAWETLCHRLLGARQELAAQASILQAYSPHTTLARGYVLLQHEGKVVSSVNDIREGQKLQLRLKDGQASATIEDIQKDT